MSKPQHSLAFHTSATSPSLFNSAHLPGKPKKFCDFENMNMSSLRILPRARAVIRARCHARRWGRGLAHARSVSNCDLTLRRIAFTAMREKMDVSSPGRVEHFTGIDEGRQDRIFRIYLVFFWTRYDCFERSGLVFWSVFGSVLTGSIGVFRKDSKNQ